MASTALAQTPAQMEAMLSDAELRQEMEEFSNNIANTDPHTQIILDALGVEYLHELDPTKTYELNVASGEVSVSDDEEFLETELGGQVAAASGSLGDFGITFSQILSRSGGLKGQASTVVRCSGPKTANVRGFQSSQVSRDPIGAGERFGTEIFNDPAKVGTRVDFLTTKLPGGKKTLSNRTVLESFHTGSCKGVVKQRTRFANWPTWWTSLNVDDTGSMLAEIDGAKTALTNFVDAQPDTPDGETPNENYSVITFKDSATLKLGRTSDGGAAKSAINSISASGGADCPEESLGAIQLALDEISSKDDENTLASIILVTDASPQSGDIDSIISTAQDQGVKVHVMLSGDCSSSSAAVTGSPSIAADILSSRDVFSRISRETGGLYVYQPSGTAQDYADLLDRIFARVSSPGTDIEPPQVTVTLFEETIWPPNHEMVLLVPQVSALDDEDLNPVIELVSVTSSEPGNGQGDGNTKDDIEIKDNGSIYVRAARSGTGEMRIYTVTYKATDASGNEGFGSADVVVVHNQ